MNAERLLSHFEQISEAPEAIARLRRFILDLAVRGKLVEQDPEDEPADDLYRAIQLQKEILFVEGKIRHDRRKPVLHGNEPFDLPAGWRWIPFGEIHWLVRGVTYTKTDISECEQSGYIPVLRAGNIGSSLTFDDPVYVRSACVSEDQHLRSGDFLIALSSGSKSLVGKAAQVDEVGIYAFGGFCGAIRLVESEARRFAGTYLKSDLYREAISRGSRGIGINNLKKEVLANAYFPLPPLAEQHRIVAKVDELMALCDQLEAARQQREQTRERLVAASLQRLNQPAEDPASFRQNAQFALQTLPSLTTTPAQIKQLRQSILNLAVRGKLVEQDPEDEPAVTWLLQRLEDSSPGRTRKPRMNIIEEENDEVLTLLPETWLWVVLDDLIEYMDSGWSPQCEDHPRSSMECWGVLKTTAVQSLSFDDKHHKELPSKLQPRPQHEAGACDILVTRAGPKNRVGISCVIDKVEPRLMISDKIIRFRVADKISPRYVALALNTGRSGEAVEQAKTGMAVMQMNISQVRLRAVPIPLPPLAEQHRIVAKVDELMALCDQLEQQLSQADQQRRRLLEAVLAEALMEPEAALALEKNYEQGATV